MMVECVRRLNRITQQDADGATGSTLLSLDLIF